MFARTFIDWIRRHTTAVLAIFLMTVLFAELSIVDISPLYWQDEMQIVEMTHGGVCGKEPSHSLVAMSEDASLDGQSWALYWLGGYVQDVAYEAMGRTGPRIVQLCWLTVLSAFVFLWARRKTGDDLFAFAMAAVAFFYQPINVSARSGRVDAQALAFVLLAVLFLWTRPGDGKSAIRVRHFLVGGFSAIAILTWVTAIVTMPVVLCEFVNESHRVRRIGAEVVVLFCLMVLGGAFTAILLLMPFFQNWDVTAAAVANVIHTNLSPAEAAHWYFMEFLKTLALMPGICALGAFLLFAQRRLWIAALGFIVFSLICMKTKVYLYRAVYLLPYAILAVVNFREWLRSPIWRKALLFLLCVMATVSISLNVFARCALEPFARPVRDYAKMKEILRSTIGEGEGVRIYVAAYELGCVARDLKWSGDNFCNAKGGQGIPSAKFLERDDYVIVKSTKLNADLLESMKQAGFELWKEIPSLEPVDLGRAASFLKRHGKLCPLGPYGVYKRAAVKVKELGS